MRAVSSTQSQPGFTPLNQFTVNGDDVNRVKPTRRICGIKAKIMIAAVLLLLLLIIMTAAIVMIAVAAAEKDSKEDNTVLSPDEEATSSTITSIPVSARVSCPLKTPAACVKAGCLYSGVDLNNQPVSSKVPKCFYPKNSYRLGSSSNIGNISGNVTDSDDTSNQIEVSAILDDSEFESLTLTIHISDGSPRSKRQAPSLANYHVNYYPDFGFSVTRHNETLFSLEEKTSLNIMRNFISVTLAVPRFSKPFGLGNFKQLEKAFDSSVYTMWTRSKEEGAHPFILLLSKNGTASGLFIDSSYPMDIKLQRDYKINVLILDTQVKIRLFTGPTIADVIRQYWSVIGNPARPPYWGLGHFYGSESVSSQTELEVFMTNHAKLGELPAEGILLSNAMNKASLPFSYTQQTRDYIKDSHEKTSARFIVTVPSSITSSAGDESYFMDTDGVDQKVFISRPGDGNSNGVPLEGLYDKKMVKYPDFTSSNAQSWWNHNLSVYSIGYGFYMHQNTPYSQINGSVGVCPDIDPDINFAIQLLDLRNLEENTLCLSGTSKKGLQLELHNKFAWHQARVTQSALKPWSVSKSPLVVSDASNPGIGQYAGHFHDSNEDSLAGLKAALNEMVTFNFLGVTLVGPNICTKEFTTHERCLKWYYISVVSPLAWSMSSNLPHLFAGDATFLESVSTVLQFRQALLPYHYDAMYKAHVSCEVPLRFLAFDYPGDEKAWLYQDQVLLGDAILYTPVLRTGEEYRVSYLPAGYWCNWVDGSCYKGPTEVKVFGTNSPASFTFLRGGTAVVTQNSANTTRDSRDQKVRLIVVLDEDGRANSTRFFDDGETANTIQTKYYTLINFNVANNTFTVTLSQNGYTGGVMRAQYERILVYGLRRKVISITRTDKEQAIRGSSLLSGLTDFYKLIIYDTNVEIELSHEFQLKWDLQLNDDHQ